MQKIKNDEYIKQSSIVFFFTLFGSVAVYIFQIICNRQLSPNEYGLLNSILALFAIETAITMPILEWLVKVYSEIHQKKSYCSFFSITKNYLYKISTILITIILTLLLLKDTWINKFKVESYEIFYILIAIVIVHALLIPLYAFLRATSHFFYSSLVSFLSDSTLLLATIIFSIWGLTSSHALFSKLLGFIISVSLSFYFVLKVINTLKESNTTEIINIDSHKARIFYQTSLGTVSLLMILNIDMVITRLIFNEQLSGSYATVSIFGKALFFFSTLTLPVFYTKCLEVSDKREELISVIKKGFAIAIISIIVGLIGLYVFIDLFVKLLNPEYLSRTKQILSYSVSMAPYAILNFFIVLNMALHKYRIFYPLIVLTLTQALVLYFYGNTINQFINIRLYFGISYLLMFIIYFFISRNKVPSTDE